MNITMLSYGEIFRICEDTYRHFLRSNEVIYSSIALADFYLENLKACCGEFTGDCVEPVACAGWGGRNCVNPEQTAMILRNLEGAPEGYREAWINIRKFEEGKIFYFPENTALYVYQLQNAYVDDLPHPAFNRMENETVEHYARRFALMTMCHERRHSQQSTEALMKDATSGLTPEDENYSKQFTEVDADNYAVYHCTDPNGMYTNII